MCSYVITDIFKTKFDWTSTKYVNQAPLNVQARSESFTPIYIVVTFVFRKFYCRRQKTVPGMMEIILGPRFCFLECHFHKCEPNDTKPTTIYLKLVDRLLAWPIDRRFVGDSALSLQPFNTRGDVGSLIPCCAAYVRSLHLCCGRERCWSGRARVTIVHALQMECQAKIAQGAKKYKWTVLQKRPVV